MPKQQKIPESIRKILEARHHDPFEVLGRHPNKKGIIIRAFIPDAANAFVEGVEGELAMQRMHDSDLFQWSGNASAVADRYRLVRQDAHGERHHYYDPYCFPPAIADFDRHLFGEGRHHHAYRILGAQPHSIDGIDGVLFATWAPNAQRISVVGDFNQW
ncbi:MAG: 1,4-alpha-glucan branching enzyme, partial [Gammaproteobacteria bacterium]|nr:1,4-alpha-glucan branching enzyme [Gammaproteobacteria bacterium]